MNIELVYAAWLLATLALFRWCEPASAALASFLGGWILLPVGIYPTGAADAVFPYWIIGLALPSDMTVTKAWAVPVATWLGVVAFDRRALGTWRPRWIDAPIALWCVWPCIAAALAGASRPGAAVASAYLAASWGLPWLLGRIYFATGPGRRLFLQGLALSALACLPIALVEGATGPRIYGWLYERHPFRFDGDVRYVGFRPIGMFEHGNQYGLWIALCALAAVWLARSSAPGRRRRWIAIAAVLVAMTLASQSAGAILLLLLGAAFLSACRALAPRRMMAAATAVVVVAGAVYVSGAVPIARIARDSEIGRQAVDAIRSTGRGSLAWRVGQDQKLLGEAVAHPVAGSAQWDWWREKGTRPWGLWLLVVGQFGFVGLLLASATVVAPAMRAVWAAPRASGWRAEAAPVVLATLVLLAALDALLNAFVFFPALVAAGALAGGDDDARRKKGRDVGPEAER